MELEHIYMVRDYDPSKNMLVTEKRHPQVEHKKSPWNHQPVLQQYQLTIMNQ